MEVLKYQNTTDANDWRITLPITDARLCMATKKTQEKGKRQAYQDHTLGVSSSPTSHTLYVEFAQIVIKHTVQMSLNGMFFHCYKIDIMAVTSLIKLAADMHRSCPSEGQASWPW